jgi:ferredoxin-NADP reductase
VYKCKIKKIENNNNIKNITFEKPLNFSYLPGQFIMLNLNNNEGFIKRAFSLSSSPSEDNLMVTVKLNLKGIITPYIFNNIKLNDEFLIEGPYGKMVFNEENDIIIICAGTGFAPMRSIMKSIYDNNINVKINLFYSTKTFKSILFYNDIIKFMKKENFNINIYLTQEKYKNFKNNRINNEDIMINNKYQYFLCGSKEFVLEKIKFLKLNNIKNINFEAW